MLETNKRKLERMARSEKREERRLERLGRINIGEGFIPPITVLRDLIKFLNQAKTLRGKRIELILEKMLELEEMTRQIPPEEPMIAAVEWQTTDPEKYKLHLEIKKRIAQLRKELARYRFIPQAEVAMGGGGKGPSVWAAWWKGDEGLRRERHLRMTSSEALDLILKLTQAGDLTRLRRCSRCHEWLFARTRHQTFCSTKCQQKNYTQSDTWKAHRRAYMRRYYQRTFSATQK